LVIRADASVAIGTGHVMRCLALAQAWQDAGGAVTFAMALDAPAIVKRLEAEGMHVARIDATPGSADDIAQTIQCAKRANARWLVLDGYHFTADHQRAIKQANLSLLWLDDNDDATHYYADLVLNQNIHAKSNLYEHREADTQLLLGSRYVLLRREFLKWQEWKRTIPDVARRVLVTLGGSDADNVTLKVIQVLQHVASENLEVVVVIGANNPHAAELHSAARASRVPMRVETNAPNMPELMAWADVAIAGAGSTCWELAFMGLPSIVMVLAENQKYIAEYLDAQGAAVYLGIGQSIGVPEASQSLVKLLIDSERRITISRTGKMLVDGRGSARVVEKMMVAPVIG